MPLDGLVLRYLTNEIALSAIGCRVEKVHQPSKDELVLLLRSRTNAVKLMISASSNSPRVHITNTAPENPKTPPMFCMLLRKHLTGGILTAVRQAGLDRILFLDFDCTNEIGDRTKLILCVEVMAKHSNIILMNEDEIIVEAVKRIDFTKSEIRQILPGMAYTLPPSQGKLNIIESSIETLTDRLLTYEDKRVSEALLAAFQGFSPLVCREITEISCGEDVKLKDLTDIKMQKLLSKLAVCKNAVENGQYNAILLKNGDEKPVDFSFMEITQYGSAYTLQEFASFSELLDEFYFERDRIDRTHQRAADLVKVIGNAIARTSRKLNLQRDELLACADREELRINAELINANQYLLQKGALFCDVENYYDENKVLRIPLDPALSPAANAQKYYKSYRKAKTAEQMLAKLIEQGEQELQYLETVADSLFRASTQGELDEIRSELAQGGYLKHKRKAGKKPDKPLPPILYKTADGFEILVGRNNLQNDRLSLKTAAKSDLWLHTQKIPGAHVIIVADNREITPATIECAAQIAAYHSKARESSLVAVDYTYAKNLKKPQGAMPGKVIYNVYNTVWVKPALPERD
jgi:predicted ribosome quality control (RQC) complex YloA/Tae2 family protein